MSWLELTLSAERHHVAALEELLLSAGAVSVTLEDREDNPILEPGVGETPLWQQVKLTALFDADTPKQQVIDNLVGAMQDVGIAPPAGDIPAFANQLQFTELEDRDWEREWLNDFEPIRCGNRLWVCPGWLQPPDPSATNIMLDPGLAFGTGTHETTLLCLQWLDKNSLTNKTVLDFGCGSGILGIAALLLGAKHACFVDNDPQALTATLANLSKNGIRQSQYTVIAADQYSASPEKKFDLVLANILAQPLIELASVLMAAIAQGGHLVLSGLQTPQQEAVSNAYRPALIFSDNDELNGWLRLCGQHQ